MKQNKQRAIKVGAVSARSKRVIRYQVWTHLFAPLTQTCVSGSHEAPTKKKLKSTYINVYDFALLELESVL